MKSIIKKLMILTLLLTLFITLIPQKSAFVHASSSTTYTYALDDNQNFVLTQDAYLPGQTVTDLGMNSPTDVAITLDGNLVVADAGNKRVLIYNPQTKELVSEITQANLDSYVASHPEANASMMKMLLPSGVFIVKDTSEYVAAGDIYVADPTAQMVYHFDQNGVLKEFFDKPTSPMYESSEFQPERISVDKAGIMYIISKGTSDGIIQLSNTGEFQGFFSSNQVNLTLKERFQQLIYTDEQLENLGLNLVPPVFTSVFIDNSGFVYSSSSGRKVFNIKKHNTQGVNVFSNILLVGNKFTDIYVDNRGIIYITDQTGYIDVYTNDGEFIYTFGTVSDVSVAGFFKTLSGIAVDDNGVIWTIDSGNSYLQSFNPTDYATTIYDAITSYNNAQYDQAIELWNKVLSLNQLSVLAHNGIAKNYLQTEQYDLAAEHFEIAGNRTLYSQAYWEIRNIWLQENLIALIGVIVLLVVAFNVLKVLDRKYAILGPTKKVWNKVTSQKTVRDILYMRTVSRKMGDTYYYLKVNRKGSYLGATIIFAITFFSYLYYVAGKGFIFQTVDINDIDLNSIILGFVVLIGLFIICSYLVTSIQDGEGTFGSIYKGFAYSLYPFILGCIFSTLFSYVATTNEVFILNLIFYAGIAWTAVLIFVSISEIQNYTFWQTIKSILLTLLFLIVILLVISFIQMTLKQLFEFVIEFFKEAIRNVFN